MLKIKSFAFLLISLLLIGSCTIEKRIHQSGFHIVKKSSHQKTERNESIKKDNIDEDLAESDKIQGQTATNKKTQSKKIKNNAVVNEIASTEKGTSLASEEEVKSNNSNTIQENASSSAAKNKKRKTTSSIEDLATDKLFDQNESKETSNNLLDDTMKILILILCFLFPFIAVWLLTEDVKLLLISILLCILFWLPGIIFALYHFFQVY
jgi:uncharacterized membrane protein YqaE (UPF0057 family)